MIELILDNRELKLKDLLQGKDVIMETLQHGDIMFRLDGQPLLIFERKTLSDLKASICDGRYKSQKARNLQAFGPSKLYYIIEGDVSFGGRSEACIVGAVVNTLLRDKVGIFSTKDIHDTKCLILEIWERIKKDPGIYSSPAVVVPTDVPAPLGMKNVPVFVNMLCQVPGISKKTAEAIYKRYPSVQEFHSSLSVLASDARLKELGGITTNDASGKARKISSSVVKAINDVWFKN